MFFIVQVGSCSSLYRWDHALLGAKYRWVLRLVLTDLVGSTVLARTNFRFL